MVSPTMRVFATLAMIAAVIGVTPHCGYASPPGRDVPPIQVDDLPFTVQPQRWHGLAGDEITVTFHNSRPEYGYLIRSCGVWFEHNPESIANCSEVTPGASDSDWAATVVVPEPLPQGPAYLHWTVSYRQPTRPQLSYIAPSPVESVPVEPSAEGRHSFTIFTVDVTATPTTTDPGTSITVDFVAPTGVPDITECGVTFVDRAARCSGDPEPRKSVRIRVPADLVETEPILLAWHVAYAGPDREQTGTRDGTIPITVSVPPPEFDVRPASLTAQPGVPFTVTFTSLTRGIDLTGCGIAVELRAECSPSGIAALIVPPDTPPGTTLRLSWDLSYVSSRPGEPPGTRKGRLSIPVEVTAPDFAVTVQPASAAPGQEITLSFRSLVEGVQIVDCIAFFPNATAGYCQRTPERWVARTSVPKDARPGALLLRWGVASRTAAGAPGEANDVIAYPVVSPPTTTSAAPTTTPPPTTTPATTPPTTITPTTTTPTTAVPSPTPTGGTQTGPPDTSPPTFVAMTDPESAAPGDRVTVTVATVDPAAQVTGCTVAFDGHGGSACREVGDRWSASVRVPDTAEPDTDVSLSWSATSRTVAGKTGVGSGTISYRVLEPGVPPPAAFTVRTDPAAAAAGKRVAVSHESLVPGVTITGCQAGFAKGAMADCHQAPGGWVADLTVPTAAPPGSGTVRWRLTYSRAGQAPGVTDGLLTFRVLPGSPPHPAGVWTGLWPFIWRILLGGLLLAGLIGWRRVAGRVRESRGRERSGADHAELPESVRVVPILPAGPLGVTVTSAGTPARHLIRLTIHRRDPRIRLHEDSP